MDVHRSSGFQATNIALDTDAYSGVLEFPHAYIPQTLLMFPFWSIRETCVLLVLRLCREYPATVRAELDVAKHFLSSLAFPLFRVKIPSE